MDLLARRGHSELELRQKLGRTYADDDVNEAIEFARESGWMTEPEELAERVAAELGRKKKGHLFINQFLKSKGLPLVAKDLDAEVERGREIAETRLGKPGPYSFDEKRKIHRWLANRGFDDETIRRVLASRPED
jgi:SOS response regulatory protein OraA/RecX